MHNSWQGVIRRTGPHLLCLLRPSLRPVQQRRTFFNGGKAMMSQAKAQLHFHLFCESWLTDSWEERSAKASKQARREEGKGLGRQQENRDEMKGGWGEVKVKEERPFTVGSRGSWRWRGGLANDRRCGVSSGRRREEARALPLPLSDDTSQLAAGISATTKLPDAPAERW